MSDSIIYPSIDLFLYDLKEGLGQDANQIDQNRRFKASQEQERGLERGFSDPVKRNG
ncbi:MAG: hypothetical protein RIM23_14320 [Coleofasciculus sp. G3-WIS-01]|uniref:hypothetical protein n=1 Tax=Coleofasciculus sp. G3-WIS-01 TaxID=3069528 RepID=UPI0032F815AC